jgi:hypothetical protein
MVPAMKILQIIQDKGCKTSHCRDLHICDGATLCESEKISNNQQIPKCRESENVERERKESSFVIGLVADTQDREAVENAGSEEYTASLRLQGWYSGGIFAFRQDVLIDLVSKLARQTQK